MKTQSRWWRSFAALLALSLVAAACSDEGDEEGVIDAGEEVVEEEPDGTSEDLDEQVEVAAGTVLDLADCPAEWDPTQGITEDTIKLAMSLPESGPVAALGGLDDGMRAWFAHMEPVAGRTVELVSADDAYDPARSLSNTEDFLQREEPAALMWMIGTPSVFAIRDLVDEACMPMLFNSTGHPAWGDPEEYPWTIGGLLSYATEAEIWCQYVNEEIGAEVPVAALYMDNDFGLAYEQAVEGCADEGLINLVESVRHDPAAADVTDEITTLASTDAEVVLLGTTGAPCPQAMAAIAASPWDPVTVLSSTCQPIASYFAPIDPAGEGVILATTTKEAGDLEDPAVQEAREALEAAGLNPDEGAFFTGVVFGQQVEAVLRQAASYDDQLDRVDIMRAAWNADWTIPLGLEGATVVSDGANDAYYIEAAQLAQYVPPGPGEELGHYEPIGELIDREGQTGTFEG